MRRFVENRHPLLWTLVLVAPLAASLVAQEAAGRFYEPLGRVAEMRHHFFDVTVVHEALIRGDLNATLQPAARLSTIAVPALLPESSHRFVENLRVAARRIVLAPTLGNAAVEVTTMLRQCGSCHQALSVYPAPRTRTGPDLGGIVGHMLEHQRALDDLLLGLVVPSNGLWQTGASRLQTAVLQSDNWPRGTGLTAEVRRADELIHEIADQAMTATTPAEQASVYSRLITTCASCHRLHARIWGPNTQP